MQISGACDKECTLMSHLIASDLLVVKSVKLFVFHYFIFSFILIIDQENFQ